MNGTESRMVRTVYPRLSNATQVVEVNDAHVAGICVIDLSMQRTSGNTNFKTNRLLLCLSQFS